jgi:ADP-ribose pyrophosphatase YjhB (NUDIX family)
MKLLFSLLAKIIYYGLYPIFGIYLHNSRRTRVLVIADNKFLLVRSFAGNQKWSLPGGGIKKNENPMKSAIREVHEETNVLVSEPEIFCIGEDRLPRNRLWPRYAVLFYLANISEEIKPKVNHPFEVIEARWFSLNDLPKNISEYVEIALNHRVKMLTPKA